MAGLGACLAVVAAVSAGCDSGSATDPATAPVSGSVSSADQGQGPAAEPRPSKSATRSAGGSASGTAAGGYSGPTRPKGAVSQGWVVVDVVDGDTIKVVKRGRSETIRLIGIDTPETVAPGEPVECFGPQASAAMTSLVLGKRVSLEDDQSQDVIDRYGRRLAFIWTEDQRGRPAKLVQWQMVNRGLASEYTYEDPHAWVDELQAAQAKAQRNDVGLWAKCPAGTTRGG